MIRILLGLGLLAAMAAGQDRTQARSMVISDAGIVATSQTLASQAGAEALARGGSAVDAAIAANAALGVAEPESSGMGGDLFALYWDAKTGKLTGLNASGWAPEGLTIGYLAGKGIHQMPQEGIDSVTVPGAVEGWAELHARYGRLPWARLFDSAIYLAGHGYPVTEMISAAWRLETPKLSRDENAARVFLPGGRSPEVGEMFRNPEMAAGLKALAEQGPRTMYEGELAAATLATRRLGGRMTAEDLKDFRAEWVTPISTSYRGWNVYELPPNSQGVAALEMLNLMAQFPLESWPARGVKELHTEIEAQKLAYADLAKYVGDPRFSQVPVAGMLSAAYAQERAGLIDNGRANCAAAAGDSPRMGSETIYLSVVDREGNIVSLIQSLYAHFGSGVVVDQYGFALQNRGGLFALDPGHPNALAGHKQQLHTIIPAFMEKGDTHIGFGIMGGLNQAQAHAQFASNIADHGMNIQAALEAPRFTKLTFGGCDVAMEDRIAPEVRGELSGMGHQITVLGSYSSTVGGGQAVIHDSKTGVNYGASDPRKDGAAVPERAIGN